MYFKRKAYDKLLEWKKLYSEKYAVLLEGARRVGKSTIAENFAKNEYRSYIMIDFSKTTSNILECFDDIGNLNIFSETAGRNRNHIVWTRVPHYFWRSTAISKSQTGNKASCTWRQVQLSGNRLFDLDKEKCKGYPDSIRGNEAGSISYC